MVILEKENKNISTSFDLLTEPTKTALTIQHVLLHQIRRILDDEDFIEVLAPVTCFNEDANRKSISDLTIFKQNLIRYNYRIYTISPLIEEETQTYDQHSISFYESYQLELEMREKTVHDLIEATENILERLLSIVSLICSNVLEGCDRKFTVPPIPFPRVTYSELLDMVSTFDNSCSFGDEIPLYIIDEVSKRIKRPIWITDYPISARKILYMEDSSQPGFLSSADLIYPEGCGLAASGGERVIDVNKISEYLRETSEDILDYQFYLDLIETDGKNSAGIEIRIKPLLEYLIGQTNEKFVSH